MPEVVRSRGRPRSRRERKQIRFGCRVVEQVNSIIRVLNRWRGSRERWWCHEECLRPEWVPAFLKLFESVADQPRRRPEPYIGAYGCAELELGQGVSMTEPRTISSHQVENISLPAMPFTPCEVSRWLSLAEVQSVISPARVIVPAVAPVKIRNGMTEEAYEQLLLKLQERNMVRFVQQEEVRQVNGIYCIPKSAGKLRLIFDGRNANRWFSEPDKVSLPTGASIAQLQYSNSEEVWGFKLDLIDFYHQIRLPEWLHVYLGLPPCKSGSRGKRKVRWPVLCTLPMGFSYSVILAQFIHEKVLRQSYATLRVDEALFLYIDDLLFQKVGQISENIKVQARVWSMFWSIVQVYKQAGLTVNMAKVEYPSRIVTFLGLEVDGIRGWVRPTAQMRDKTTELTRQLLDRPSCKLLEQVIGCWVWVLLVCRPWLAIMFMIYRNFHAWQQGRTTYLWKSAREELETLLTCLPIIRAECKGDWSEVYVETTTTVERGGGRSWVNGWLAQTVESRWRFREPLNVLCLRTLDLVLRHWIGTKRNVDVIACLGDSGVCAAIEKGRSSSYPLRRWLLQLLWFGAMFNWRVTPHCNPKGT